jgi:acetoin:2,6-dichlorophenolindophenol oxidoreductase subunit alpha
VTRRPGDLPALYRQMRLIRSFEDAVQSLFTKGDVHGTTHLYSGQEASAVGVCSALAPGDRAACTYRGHGAALAMGVEPEALMAELLGRATGVCGGRAGSMNVVDLEHGLIGCFGIVGGSIAAATGQALAFKAQGGRNVAVAFFGDGATNQAYFHECLNLAAVERLPAVFVCENNLYAEFSPIEDVTAGDIADRPAVFGIPTEVVDGNDVEAVHAAAERTAAHARSGDGPAFIESRTYRFAGHSRSDPGTYRKPGELDAWRRRDPLVIAAAALREAHGMAEEDIRRIDGEVQAQVEALVERGLAAPWPDPSESPSEFAEAAA